MDQQKVTLYLMANQNSFPAEKMMFLKQKLEAADEAQFETISMLPLKDPSTILICSVLVGSFGVDRFMLGDTGMGVLKLLTFGGCGVLTIIDWFTTHKKAKEMNFNNVISFL